MRFVFVAVGISCCFGAPQPIEAMYFCPPRSSCPVFNPDNGHYYALIPGPTWHEAKAEAETYSFLGAPGHLATITSAEENAFLVHSRLTGTIVGPWIGASDADVEGEWRWVTGPEAGQLFWLGGIDGTAVGYSNWLSEQPNDNQLYGGQDYIGWYTNYWNDTEPNRSDTGLIEFSVPEPSSFALLIVALGAVGIVARRRMVRR